MAKITLKNITKKFGKVTALKDVSLEIQDGEFFVVFGPAGAGKTTLLNIIAGISDPDSGEIYYDQEAMNFIEPQVRNASMVFENYALYPQKNVYENIASPLRSKLHKETEESIDKKVRDVAATVGLTDYLDRKPVNLSNGQRQRVALARALVRDARVFLLDEPIAHLDAKLRNAMRKELKLIQDKFNTTTVYVTHDFNEAMSLGDRIAVIRDGEIIQVGTNLEVYFTPKDEFVSKLFGDCEINIIPAEINVIDGNKKICIDWSNINVPVPVDLTQNFKDGQKVDLGCRTNAILYSTTPKEGYSKGKIYTVEPLGNKTELVVSINDQLIRFIVSVNERFNLDDDIYLSINPDNIIFFDSESKEYIGTHNANKLVEV
jgi:multiple sugar transport system ATP-binding protein